MKKRQPGKMVTSNQPETGWPEVEENRKVRDFRERLKLHRKKPRKRRKIAAAYKVAH